MYSWMENVLNKVKELGTAWDYRFKESTIEIKLAQIHIPAMPQWQLHAVSADFEFLTA